jgi:hypothetical protein
MRNFFLVGTWTLTAAFTACSSESTPPDGTGGSGGTGGAGGAGPAVCDTDYARITSDTTPVSFEADIMPIFQVSCVANQCHCSRETNRDCAPSPKAQLFLGVKSSLPQPSDVVQQVLDNLVDVDSATVPTVKRIASGDPANSFLVMKISDTYNEHGFDCVKQDQAAGCGDPMPPAGATLCTQSNGQERFETIVRWVAQL